MEQQAELGQTPDKQDQPGYGKPGRHSWKIERQRGWRNTRRLMGGHPLSARQREDRAAALSEYLPPRLRARLLRNYKREQLAITQVKRPAGEPARAQRRAELKTYARKTGISPRRVWSTYQDEKRKGLQKAA